MFLKTYFWVQIKEMTGTGNMPLAWQLMLAKSVVVPFKGFSVAWLGGTTRGPLIVMFTFTILITVNNDIILIRILINKAGHLAFVVSSKPFIWIENMKSSVLLKIVTGSFILEVQVIFKHLVNNLRSQV